MTKTKQNSTTFINYEGTGEKLKDLKENAIVLELPVDDEDL